MTEQKQTPDGTNLPPVWNEKQIQAAEVNPAKHHAPSVPVQRDIPALYAVSKDEASNVEVMPSSHTVLFSDRMIVEVEGAVKDRAHKKQLGRIETAIKQGILPNAIEFPDAQMSIKQADLTKNVRDVYPAIMMNGAGPASTSFVQMSKSIGVPLKKQVDDLRIVTGICLFGLHGAQGVDANGAKHDLLNPANPVTTSIEKIEVSPELSFYEAESVARLTDFIRQVAYNSAAKVEAVVQLPKAEYYSYALAAVKDGYLSREQYFDWVKEVDKRHELLKEMIIKALPEDLPVKFADPLESVTPIIAACSEADMEQTVQDIKMYLANSSDSWKQLLESKAGKRANTLNDINYLGYQQAYLETARCHPDDGAFTLAIENPIESKIFRHLAENKAVVKAEPMRLATLLVHEQAFVQDSVEERPVQMIHSVAGRPPAMHSHVSFIEKPVTIAPRHYMSPRTVTPEVQKFLDEMYGAAGEVNGGEVS